MLYSACSTCKTSDQVSAATQISAFHLCSCQRRSEDSALSVWYHGYAAQASAASAVFRMFHGFLCCCISRTGLLIFLDSTGQNYVDSWLGSAESINISVSSRFYKIWIFSFFCVFHINHPLSAISYFYLRYFLSASFLAFIASDFASKTLSKTLFPLTVKNALHFL